MRCLPLILFFVYQSCLAQSADGTPVRKLSATLFVWPSSLVNGECAMSVSVERNRRFIHELGFGVRCFSTPWLVYDQGIAARYFFKVAVYKNERITGGFGLTMNYRDVYFEDKRLEHVVRRNDSLFIFKTISSERRTDLGGGAGLFLNCKLGKRFYLGFDLMIYRTRSTFIQHNQSLIQEMREMYLYKPVPHYPVPPPGYSMPSSQEIHEWRWLPALAVKLGFRFA